MNTASFVTIASEAVPSAVYACWPLHHTRIVSLIKWPAGEPTQDRCSMEVKDTEILFPPIYYAHVELRQVVLTTMRCRIVPNKVENSFTGFIKFNWITNQLSFFIPEIQRFFFFRLRGGGQPLLFTGVVGFDEAVNKIVVHSHKSSVSRETC